MIELSLYNLISNEQYVNEKNCLYKEEVLNMKRQSKEKFDKYYEALILSQQQICELKVSIAYIMSLKNKNIKRKLQLKYYKKLINEKEKIHKDVVNFLQVKLKNRENLYINLDKIVKLENDIQKEYFTIASKTDLIINILYKNYKQNNKM